MSRTCTICTHDERAEIDNRLVRREPYRNIAEQFSVSPAALSRHVKVHLPQELALADRKRREDEADELFGDVRRLQLETFLILNETKKDGLHKTSLAAIREATRLVTLRYQVREWAKLEKRLEELEEQAAS